MELQIRRSNGGAYIIDISGEMDLYNAFRLNELVNKMIEKKVTLFVVNFEKVAYIDSSGIGTLIKIYSMMKKKGLRFTLAGVHGSVKKVIELTKLNDYFPIAPTIDDALRAVERPKEEGEAP